MDEEKEEENGAKRNGGKKIENAKMPFEKGGILELSGKFRAPSYSRSFQLAAFALLP